MNTIDPRIHQVLDGELPIDALPAELRHVVQTVTRAADLLAEPVPGPSLESRIMAEVRRPAPSYLRRLARWLATPHAVTLRVRPVWSLAFAAVAALFTLFFARDAGPQLQIGEHEGIAQFVGRFPNARSVHVVGTFNDWRAGTIPLEDRHHDGVWTATVVLPTGTYEYMFVVDGERWVPDHLADRLVADDFGRENSVVIVRPVHR